MSKLKLFLIFLLLVFFSPSAVFAQDFQILGKEEFYKAKVLEVTEEGEISILDQKHPYQVIKIRFLEGPQKGEEIITDIGKKFALNSGQKVKKGQTVIALKMQTPEGSDIQIIDKYRLPQILTILISFFILVVGLSHWKGLGSIIGLAVSIAIVTFFIVPQILAGHDPVLVSIAGSAAIMFITIYLAHGFSKKTTVALASTIICLAITGILAVMFVENAKLTGLGSEDAGALRFGQTAKINFSGLLLGGIIIGALGVLDDVTTSLSASVFELAKSNPTLKFRKLAQSGLSIGREHISSLVNTLVLAYAGASMPIFLFIVLNPTGQPIWFILNSELITEEIIRTLAGSFGLVFAVPITAILAAWTVTRTPKNKSR